MELSLEQALDSKVYVKNDSVVYKSPRHYFEPFLEKVEPLAESWRVRTSGAISNAEEDGEKNTAYGRIAIEAKLPQFSSSISGGTIGMVYALDTQKPIVKAFAGQNVSLCMNLCIFGADDYIQQDLLAGLDRIYAEVTKMSERAEKTLGEFMAVYEQMNDRMLTVPEIEETFGRLIRLSKPNKFNTGLIINAANMVFNESSRYAISGDTMSQWQLYNAVTDGITNKVDIFDQPTKTVILNKIFLDQN